ncbi:MAG: lipid A biosynthesis (KDO)2-(lauroyl)-lipid IVA acyltransferase [Tannerella sp.]|jgi:predicted LPLAT superfamily acyltransferase|nr:lipid A biosynthesis (KDO)2-(lauroyl)-lipid IVA acyltransferase [Tannerella sp.]
MAADKEREWKGVTGGSAFGQKAMKIMFSVVNVRVGYAILVFIIPFYMLFARKGYLSIYRYFRVHHGYSPAKSFVKTYRNHFLFGQAILDRFAIYAGQDHFKVDNPDNDLFLEMMSASHGCIMASSHIGNPELCGYLLKQNKKRINGLIFGGEAKEVQKNRSKVLENNNVRLIPVTEDMSHIFIINEALNNGEMVSMLCDRNFGSSKTVECDFLNGKADFPIGAFALALQFNVPVIALFVLKVSASLYRIHIIPVSAPALDGVGVVSKREQINAMVRSFARALEDIVKKYPEQWFNFYDFLK